jgi:hypothetical protein
MTIFLRAFSPVECLKVACAVKRRRFTVGESAIRRQLQPEARIAHIEPSMYP